VFSENSVSSAWLFYEMQITEFRTQHSMSDSQAVTDYLTSEDIQPQQIHNQMTFMYGNSAPSYAIVTHWVAKFCWGRINFEDEPQSEYPPEAVREKYRVAENVILQNCQNSVTADIMGINNRSAKTILHEHLFIKNWFKNLCMTVPVCLTRK